MPLFDLMTQQRAVRVPFERDFKLFQGRLSAGEIVAIDAWIDERIAGDEIHTAGWMPGSNWTGTVLEARARVAADMGADSPRVGGRPQVCW